MVNFLSTCTKKSVALLGHKFKKKQESSYNYEVVSPIPRHHAWYLESAPHLLGSGRLRISFQRGLKAGAVWGGNLMLKGRGVSLETQIFSRIGV